jgi:hypothetical protein
MKHGDDLFASLLARTASTRLLAIALTRSRCCSAILSVSTLLSLLDVNGRALITCLRTQASKWHKLSKTAKTVLVWFQRSHVQSK